MESLDAYDQTPVLDIKPYSEDDIIFSPRMKEEKKVNIAIITNEATMNSTIPLRFEDGSYMLIINAETDELLQVIKATDSDKPDEYFAQETSKWDCEAVICGSIEETAFNIIAGACITRYFGGDMQAEEALAYMMNDQLGMITDFVGGSGCVSHGVAHSSECQHHHDEDDEDEEEIKH